MVYELVQTCVAGVGVWRWDQHGMSVVGHLAFAGFVVARVVASFGAADALAVAASFVADASVVAGAFAAAALVVDAFVVPDLAEHIAFVALAGIVVVAGSVGG